MFLKNIIISIFIILISTTYSIATIKISCEVDSNNITTIFYDSQDQNSIDNLALDIIIIDADIMVINKNVSYNIYPGDINILKDCILNNNFNISSKNIQNGIIIEIKIIKGTSVLKDSLLTIKCNKDSNIIIIGKESRNDFKSETKIITDVNNVNISFIGECNIILLNNINCWNFPCHSCGDYNGDNLINSFDSTGLLNAWGFTKPYNECADFNHDGSIGASDASILLAHWGYSKPDCPAKEGCQ